ncbi:MAG: hypothetical protein AAF404_06615 [Pseudomonadota bacterium]
MLSEEKELQIFPAVFKLEPGAIRTVFIKSDKSLSAPRYYRLRIEELQTDVGHTQTAQLAFLRAFDIPVFVEPPGAKPDLTTTAVVTADGIVRVELSNQGNSFFAATNFSIVRRDNADVIAEHSALSYVLPGSESSVELALRKDVFFDELKPSKSTTVNHGHNNTEAPGIEEVEVRVSGLDGKQMLAIPIRKLP